MYRCPNCGGEMVFSPEKQKLVCGYCDSEFTVEEFDEKKGVKADEHDAFEPEEDEKYYRATVFTCPQCGGELISTSDTAATFCSFCGASVLLSSRVSNELKPDLIIPFKKSREDCIASYKKMLSRAIFAPSAMKKESEIEKFRSIYMPYWIYSYDYEGKLRVKGSTSSRKGDYIYTKHYDLSSDIRLDYEGISFDASSSFADNLSNAVAPFNISEADTFRAAYMTGHYADTKDIDADIYEPDAAEIVRNHAAEELADKGDYSSYDAGEEEIKKGFEPAVKSIKLGFFPVWFLSGRNPKGDRVSYAVMNGQTGKIAADLPVSVMKYLVGSLILAVPIFLLLSFVINLTFTPRVMLVISMILGITAMVIANYQMNRVYTRENNLDDKGWQALQGRAFNKTREIKTPVGKVKVKGKESLSFLEWAGIIVFAFFGIANVGVILAMIIPLAVAALVFFAVRAVVRSNRKNSVKGEVFPAPMKEKIGRLIKPVLGAVASLVVIVWNPYQDYIHYAVAIAALALTVWTFVDIIKDHNRLTLRKLPQLGKRGGDEDA